MILNGLACLGLAYSGCNINYAVFFLTLSLMLHGAVSTGVLASVVDLAPNYAGVVLGVNTTISIMTGFVSPIIVGYITFENNSITAWQHIFEICAAMVLVCGAVFIFFGDSTLQKWNNLSKEDHNEKEPREMMPLYAGKPIDGGQLIDERKA